MGGITLASIGRLAAAKLIRTMLASQHLQDAARIPVIQAQTKRGGEAGVGAPASEQARASAPVPSPAPASVQPKSAAAPANAAPSSSAKSFPAAPAAPLGNTERAAALFREGRTEVKAGSYSKGLLRGDRIDGVLELGVVGWRQDAVEVEAHEPPAQVRPLVDPQPVRLRMNLHEQLAALA